MLKIFRGPRGPLKSPPSANPFALSSPTQMALGFGFLLWAQTGWAILTCEEIFARWPDQWIQTYKPELRNALPPGNFGTLTSTINYHTTVIPEGRRFRIKTDIFRANNPQANLAVWERIWDPPTRTLTLDRGLLHQHIETHREVPHWVKPNPTYEFVPGRGLPTTLFLGLHQLKVAGIEHGSIRTLDASSVLNRTTIMELYRQTEVQQWLSENSDPTKIPVSLLERFLPETQTGQYILTFAQQSGHKVTKAKMSTLQFDKVTNVYSDYVLEKNPSLAKKFKKTELPPQILSSFSWILKLEPVD